MVKYSLLASSLVRDVLYPLLLTCSNTALLVQYRMNIAKKHDMTTTTTNNKNQATNKCISIMKHDLTWMTLSITLKSLICRIPMFVSRFYYVFPLLILNRPFYILILALFHLSYFLNFFIYLRFNRKYRYTFLDIFKKFSN